MKQKPSNLLIAALASLPLVGFGVMAGCEREGPFERTGREVDDAADDVGEELEEIGDDIKDAAD